MKRRLLIAVGCVAGIVGVRVLITAPSWFKQRRDNRQFIAANNLTPERLIARCGSPVGDETKNLYPIIARNLTYKSETRGTVVFKFTKTAEESSDWVFTSMQDSNSASEYESPRDRILALPCLDSRK
jgi:type II secretory pathway pseudopilin PulG